MPILTLSPIFPRRSRPAPARRAPAKAGPSRQRSSPSSERSIRSAWASRPGPRARSRRRSTPRLRRMIATPSTRLERPDQDAGADSRRLARHIQHPGDAVGQINVGVAALEKERAIARRHPPIGVPGGVADDISLGLDNAAAGHAFRQFPHQELADQKAGERGGVDRQLRAGERRRPMPLAARLQSIRSTRCAREGPGSNGSPKYCVSRATLPSRNSMMLTV